MTLLSTIRHAIARWRFNREFRSYDKEIARIRKQHKRGVLEATAAKRRAVNMALAGKTLVKLS